MKRPLYFGAGPAALPEEVLKQASEAVLDYNQSGLSILEIPHRGKAFEAVVDESIALTRKLCNIGSEYEVLWMQGGGRMQFATVPMNFLPEGSTAAYADTGHWAHEAAANANFYGKSEIITSSRDKNYTEIPPIPTQLNPDWAYVHITTNNTIYGTQYADLPVTNIPLVADMSSDFLCRELDFSCCALFYAVAQKNIGPAGATLVVVHKDFLAKSRKNIPSILSYQEFAKAKSLLNTPPVFAVYASLLTLRWIEQRGLKTIEADNRKKAALLYAELERNALFTPLVATQDRSLMNAVFRGTDEALETEFAAHCKERNILGINGHRSVGGFRVSMYNAVTVDAVETLIQAMQEFEKSRA